MKLEKKLASSCFAPLSDGMSKYFLFTLVDGEMGSVSEPPFLSDNCAASCISKQQVY